MFIMNFCIFYTLLLTIINLFLLFHIISRLNELKALKTKRNRLTISELHGIVDIENDYNRLDDTNEIRIFNPEK
jgi:hypothetical protein